MARPFRPPAAVRAVAFALAQRGKPYVFGASGTDLYDCPSLVQESYRYTGISLPRTVRPATAHHPVGAGQRTTAR
ncbi:NlpC/P60 family protein [Fodinicola feengrottensis]|uniref:NlpC/P60 family protein n=1 Tax=Fodinicola feengrottensis TaxID=435914 RepID=UPI0013D2D941|nr:NlpC/P60 family protein [Fodinicola feengrottensis]